MRTVLAWFLELVCRPLDTRVYALTPVRADDREPRYYRDL